MEPLIVAQRMQDKIDGLRGLNWEDGPRASEATTRLLDGIAADKALLGALVKLLPSNTTYLSKCEKDYNLEKYVLFNDSDSGVRLRLHVIHPSGDGIPHSHRMDFASFILKGHYQHTLYGPLDDGSRLFDSTEIYPLKIGVESAGQPYFISHQLIHNVRVQSDRCISLMLRSPYRKKRAIQYDLESRRTWWRYGSEDRTEESLANCEPITRVDVDRLIGELEDGGVI